MKQWHDQLHDFDGLDVGLSSCLNQGEGTDRK